MRSVRAAVGHGPVTVFSTHRPPSANVGYVDQIVEVDPAEVELRFSPASSLQRYDMDVVHVHHPEAVLGRRTGWARVRKALELAVMLKRHRIALVRTVHGSNADVRGGWSARLADGILTWATTAVVVLDSATRVPRRKTATLIPHGHYRDRFVGYPRAEQVPGRLLHVAPTLRKPVVSTLREVARTAPQGFTFRLAGDASAHLTGLIDAAVASAPETVSSRVERISDGAIVQEICAAEAVVLPEVTALEDLNVVFVALSLDRPVLLSETPATRRLAEKVGRRWVRTYPDLLSNGTLIRAAQELRSDPPTGHPDLEGRDLASTSRMHAAVFRAAAAKVGRRSRPAG